MSFTVRYGEEPEDELVVMRERPLKLVGNVFRYRDKIMQGLATTLVPVRPALKARVQETPSGGARSSGFFSMARMLLKI